MRIIILGVIAFVLGTVAAAADEKVITTDGRAIILKDDGTYEITGLKKARWQDYVIVVGALFRHTKRDFSQVIDFMPKFKNMSNKTIVGIEFTSTFRNVFGKKIKVLSGTVEESIKPGKISTARMFYVFKDNQFIDGEMYDKLLTLVTEKTGKHIETVSSIVFEGGEIVKF